MMSHRVAHVAAVPAFFPGLRGMGQANVSQLRPKSFLQFFDLYIRPPPAF